MEVNNFSWPSGRPNYATDDDGFILFEFDNAFVDLSTVTLNDPHNPDRTLFLAKSYLQHGNFNMILLAFLD